MSSNLVRGIVVFAACMATAIAAGVFIAQQNYSPLVALVVLAAFVATVVAPGYWALVAAGLLFPFSLPIPFIYKFPLLFSALGICLLKYVLNRAMTHRKFTPARMLLSAPMLLFFGWVAMRYAVDPVFPNVLGFGGDVTGFRAYLAYLESFLLVICLGLFAQSQADILGVIRWMVWISLLLCVLLIPLVFTKSPAVGEMLMRAGMHVSLFDNGLLRFIPLPSFGLLILSAALFPSLLTLTPWKRRSMIAVATLAIILGGNRASFLMGLTILFGAALIQRKIALFVSLLAGSLLLLGSFRIIGETYHFSEGYGFLRILSIASSRVAQMSDADANVRWRQARWERALQDIRERPWIGHGYGGLQHAFLGGGMDTYSDLIDIDVAAGSIHNGFLASARALGVPAVILYSLVYITGLWTAFRQSWQARKQGSTATADLYAWVFVNAAAMLLAIYVGADLSGALAWFFLCLGTLVGRYPATTTTEDSTEEDPESPEGPLLQPQGSTS